ncbi:MAG: hypothetical protein Q7W05_12680 [Deltaproteobacteria bacterium]|nr:hypothetical protein [Deltaproteobacteria bacterium]
MKKTMVGLMVLAGISLLAGILMKLGIMPKVILGTVPSTYVQLTQVFLLAAIAVKCCCGECKCEK